MDGTDLINDAGGDVIAVLIQYRLGAFGEGTDACRNVDVGVEQRPRQVARVLCMTALRPDRVVREREGGERKEREEELHVRLKECRPHDKVRTRTGSKGGGGERRTGVGLGPPAMRLDLDHCGCREVCGGRGVKMKWRRNASSFYSSTEFGSERWPRSTVCI